MVDRPRFPARLPGLCFLFLLSAAAAQPPAALKEAADRPAVQAADKPAAEEAPTAQEQELKRLRLQAELREQELLAELAGLRAEKARLEAELALTATRETRAAAPEQARLEALKRSEQLREAALKAELAPISAEQERLRQAQALAGAQLEAELAASKREAERLKAAQELQDAEHRARIAELRRDQERLAAENALAAERLKAELTRLSEEQARAETEARAAAALLSRREGQDLLQEVVQPPLDYPKQPFRDGVLFISDRRIELDGPIVSGTADYVCDRIDYFNNQDAGVPIFLVINNSPGGSVMQGYRILKAIETSAAPVHVVVKSFAASMAAAITTLAPHSYAYPNAILLHHQMSGGAQGNMTDLEQEVRTMREWERRLSEPIARKMGLSLEAFKERMYQAKRSGDWDEFADKAVELKWVDHLVTEIREQGIRKKPADKPVLPAWSFLLKRDEHGKPYVSLPPLEPFDCYFMVNPRGFYRVEGR